MKKDELVKLINKKEIEIENNKLKRTIFTIIGIAIFFFLISFKKISDFKSFLIVLIGCLVGAGFYFYLNLFIFIPLFTKSFEENQMLENLKKQYNEMDK